MVSGLHIYVVSPSHEKLSYLMVFFPHFLDEVVN
jgi:hypothetical protein